MFCSNCGHEITGAGNFCSECGAEQKNAAPQNGTSVPNTPDAQMRNSASNATGVQWKESVQGRMVDDVGVSQQRPALKTEFKINTAKTFCILGILLLIAGAVMALLTILAVMMNLLSGNSNIIGIIVLVVFGVGIFAFCAIAALLAFTFGNQCIYFSDKSITVKKLWSKQPYECADIVNVTCGRYQVYYRMVYYIEWMFSDKKRYRVSTGEEGFYETAGYLYNMANNGIIHERAVTPETKEMLRRYAVKAW